MENKQPPATKGYILLHRQLQDHWVWQSKPFSYGQAWADLLFRANWCDKRVPLGKEIISVKKGTVVTSMLKLCDAWGWGRKRVNTFLNMLEKDHMVVQQRDNHKTVITIENYGLYQDFEPTEGQRKVQRGIQRGYNGGTTGDHNEYIINNNNTLERKDISTFESFWSAYPRKVSKQAAIKAWNKKKPDEELISAILKDIARKKESEEWKKNNGQFIPYPATYLRGERWTDELGTVAAITDDPFPDLQEL